MLETPREAIAGLLSHPARISRDAACGDAKLVPLGKLACTVRTLRQSSQNRIALVASLLEMPAIASRGVSTLTMSV